ncbi:glycosyl hydrolase 108 family protein [uncultured Paraglaciecola sp.]|uniref:glycoside hydrolase family 108 protein n=1 Tax=uncultured Paraglaciecola sp. TaxID=1765024 RepID=UPI00262826ED|nr:glycosyl hydrolase 108 family protein [uncultured Paraglaciecola sp.]
MTEQENFDLYVKWVLFAEGVYADDENDKGGTTHYGISARFLKTISWTGGAPTKEQAISLYRQYFWLGWQCDRMHPMVAWCACDAFIQHPSKSAAMMVQEGLGVTVDGKIGPITLEAAQSPNLLLFWRRYRLARVRFYNDILANDPTQADFIDGWHDRMHKLTEGMYFAGLIQRDESGKGLKAAVTSSTAKATTAGITIGGIVMWLQSNGINLESIIDALPEGGFVGLAVAWLAKHNFKR